MTLGWIQLFCQFIYLVRSQLQPEHLTTWCHYIKKYIYLFTSIQILSLLYRFWKTFYRNFQSKEKGKDKTTTFFFLFFHVVWKIRKSCNREKYKMPQKVGCRGASQLGGSLLGIPPGYKANKLSLRLAAVLLSGEAHFLPN